MFSNIFCREALSEEAEVHSTPNLGLSQCCCSCVWADFLTFTDLC